MHGDAKDVLTDPKVLEYGGQLPQIVLYFLKQGKLKGNEIPLTVKEAVYLYTMGSAYMSFEDGIKGSIEEDKLADFIVLDRDIFEVDTKEIKDIKVLKTIIDGDIVYSA